MKIGILTFHYSINPGSVLQAFCVYKLLKKSFPNAKVEIINLIPSNREKQERDFFGFSPPFIKYRKILKYRSIRKFIKNNTQLSKHSSKVDLAEQISFINEQQYDYIFTGSDTVWMFSAKLNNLLPNIYFLPPEIKAKKFSIAASVDPLTNEEIYLEKHDMLSRNFDSYEGLYVRDNVTYDLLKKIGVTKAIKIADPSLLYEFEEDLKIKINKQKDLKKKVVSIWVTDHNISKYIKELLTKTSPEFIFIDRKKHIKLFEDHVIYDLNQYSKIDILITDRFHRSIFAMKLSNTLVINIERYNKNPILKSKGRDLFSDIGLPEYCIRFEKDNQQEFDKKLLGLISKWDFSEFQKREELLKKYIRLNQTIWLSAVSKLSPTEVKAY